MEKVTATFVQERTTKNTVRYTEEGEEPYVVGTLYIQKHALGNPPPQRVEVVITGVGE